MTTRKRGESWTVDVVFTHADGRVQRITKTSPVNTRRGAEDYERQLRAALLDGSFGRETSPVPTLGAFADAFLLRATTQDKPSSVQSKRQILKAYLLPRFASVRLDRIGAEAVDRLKAGLLEEKYAPKTVNNILTVLRSLLELAVEYGKLPAMPKGKFWMRVPKQRFDFLDFSEAERLVQAADGDWRPVVTLALNTGLRMGELQGLEWNAVDLVAGRLRVVQSLWRGQIVPPKNHREREVPLNSRALAALHEALPSKLRGPYVFSYARNSRGEECAGRPLHNDTMRNGILRAARAAGLRPIGWHTLRHTFASHLVMRGVPLKAVQELLGHASLEMTMRYAHLSPDVRKDAVAALESPSK